MHSHRDERTPDELAKLGYERGDVGLRTIAIWVFWFFFFAAASGIATALIYPIFVPSGFKAPEVEARKRAPTAPLLQDDVTVKTDIRDMRHHEQEILHSAGPSDQVKGAFRIPIDHAIDLWSERHLGGDGHE